MRPFRYLAACALVALAAASVPAQDARAVIAVGTLVDGTGQILRDTRIVIQNAKIVAIDPKAAPVDYDLSRFTVTPGWIDTHIHLNWHFDANRKSVSGNEKAEDAALYSAED